MKTLTLYEAFSTLALLGMFATGNVIQVSIDSTLLQLHSGDPILATIKVSSPNNNEVRDYIIRSTLIDPDGKKLYVSEQTVAISTTTSIVVTIPTQSNLPDGSYNLIAEIISSQTQNVIATASESIIIKNGSFFNQKVEQRVWIYWSIWILIVILIIFSVISYIHHKRNEKRIAKNEASLAAILKIRD